MGEFSIWVALAIVCGAGAVGGVVNALMSDNGFIMPRKEPTEGGYIVRPGFLSNLVIGAVAAGVSWGLYGPVSAGKLSDLISLTLSALVGAVLVGVGGA